jgi:hypothetical protein
MTIKEIIQELERTKDYPASDPASDEALDAAIDTMRKYQKIEQILDDCLLDDWEILKSIREVLENAIN